MAGRKTSEQSWLYMSLLRSYRLPPRFSILLLNLGCGDADLGGKSQKKEHAKSV
jgi:hypothetical protein